jgi:large subunit ribosomal protein L30
VAQLKVTYAKSSIGYAHDQKRTIESLGLRKLNQSVLLPDNSAVRGMVFKVRHLVTVEEVGDGAAINGKEPAS